MGTPGQAKNAQRKQEGQERRAHIMQLRASGMQPSAIAEQMQLSVRSVNRHISAALSGVVSVATAEYRALEATRLDALLHAYWDQATDGDLQAAYFVSKIIGQRMALFGLAQPPEKEDDAGDKLALLIRRLSRAAREMEADEPTDEMERAVAVGEGRDLLEAALQHTARPNWQRALAQALGHDNEQEGELLPNE